MEIHMNGDTAQWIGDEGEVIDEYETCGCRYADLGMCQGCPTCSLHYEEPCEEEDFFAGMSEWDIYAYCVTEDEGSDPLEVRLVQIYDNALDEISRIVNSLVPRG